MRNGPIPAGEPARILSEVPLFAGLDRVALAKLAAHFERVRFEPGEIVFREGDPGDAFYVVLDGTFTDYVEASETGVDRRLATRGRGTTFGDIALPLEPAPLDHRASRGGGRGAPARAGALPRARCAGARRGARDRGDPQRAGVARQRPRRCARSSPRRRADRRRDRPGPQPAHARVAGIASPSAGGRGRARPRDPGPDVADAAARGSHAGGLARARHARGHGARPRPRALAGGVPGPGGDRCLDACRRRARAGGPRRVRHAELGSRRGGAVLRRRRWPRRVSSTGSRSRSSRGRAAGSPARPPRWRWRVSRSGRRCPMRPAAWPCLPRLSRS